MSFSALGPADADNPVSADQAQHDRTKRFVIVRDDARPFAGIGQILAGRLSQPTQHNRDKRFGFVLEIGSAVALDFLHAFIASSASVVEPEFKLVVVILHNITPLIAWTRKAET
jgi:hypothetical protein